ncbi:MAG: Fur family transcriptional regulator [Vicinamibacteria bacterium]
MTVQRRVILEELVSRRDHPSADQIYDAVEERLPGLSRTTVYRVLDAFVQAGAVRRVPHPDAVARFDPISERHHHLLCETCGRLFDLEDAEVRPLSLPRSLGSFVIRDYSINFTGVCSGCRNSTKEKKRSCRT